MSVISIRKIYALILGTDEIYCVLAWISMHSYLKGQVFRQIRMPHSIWITLPWFEPYRNWDDQDIPDMFLIIFAWELPVSSHHRMRTRIIRQTGWNSHKWREFSDRCRVSVVSLCWSVFSGTGRKPVPLACFTLRTRVKEWAIAI